MKNSHLHYSLFHHMSWDFGVFNQADLDEFLTEHINSFSLIAVSEKFDESMVLLKRMFGWELKDILYQRVLDACKVQTTNTRSVLSFLLLSFPFRFLS